MASSLMVWSPWVDAPQPSPHRVEWDQYPVGGLVLVNPWAPDSLSALPLPAGSILSVPRLVVGEEGLPNTKL